MIREGGRPAWKTVSFSGLGEILLWSLLIGILSIVGAQQGDTPLGQDTDPSDRAQSAFRQPDSRQHQYLAPSQKLTLGVSFTQGMCHE